MADVEDLRIILRAEVAKAVTDLGKASRSSRTATKSFEDLSKQFKAQVSGALSMKNAFGQMATSMAAGLGAFTLVSKAVQGVSQYARESVQAFQVQEQAVAKLEGVLRATGGAAGLTSKEMQAFASDLQASTQFGDEAIIGLQGTLATFKSVSGDTFKDATRLAVDLSAAFGGDLQSSAMQLGKALEDPVRGVSALRRVGVSFSETQLDLIKSLVETGDKASAQALILKELEGQVGGVAAAMADTASGALVQYKNITSDTKEEVGRFMVNGLEPLTRLFSKVSAAIHGVLKEQNDYNDALKAVQSGSATTDQRLLVLKNQAQELNKQIATMEIQKGLAEDLGGYTQEQYEFAKAALGSMADQIRWLELSVSLSGKAAAAAKEKAAAEAKAAEESKAAQDKLDAYLKRVGEAYAQTSLGRIELLRKEIAEFEAYAATAVKTAPMVEAILGKLREDLYKLENPKNSESADPAAQRIDALYASTKEGIAAAKNETLAFVQAQKAAALAAGMAAEEIAKLDAILSSLQDTAAESTSASFALFDESFTKMVDALDSFSKSMNDSMGQLAQRGFLEFFEAMGQGSSAADSFGQAFGRMAQEASRQVAAFALAAGVRILAETGIAGLPIALALFALAGVSAMAGGALGHSMGGPRTVDYERYITDPVVEAEKRLAQERLRILKAELEEEKRLRDDNLRKLEEHFSQEFEVLRDLWDRGLVSTAEFESRATALRGEQETQRGAAEQPYREAQDALDAEEDAQRQAQEALEKAKTDKVRALATQAKDLQDKLNAMSGWDKFWSGKDEQYEKSLATLDRRIQIVQNASTLDQVRAASTGADFITNGPEFLKVGDNPGGRERVRVEPIGSPNIHGPRGDTLVIQINAPVYGVDDLYQKLEQAGRRLSHQRRVLTGAFS